MPVAGIRLQDVRQRDDEGRQALGGIEQAGIGGRVFRTEHVGAGRGEEAENLAPGKEDQRRADHEGPWRGARDSEQPVGHAARGKGDRHGVFAPDLVRHPAEERPRAAVGEIVDHAGDDQRACPEQDHRLRDAVVLGDQCDLRRHHQSARGHQDEHDVEQPEHRRCKHLTRRARRPRLQNLDGGSGRNLTRYRRTKDPCQHEDDGALADGEPEEGVRISDRGNHVLDRNHGDGRAGAKARRRQADGETATVGEPFHGVADAGGIDGAGANAGYHGAEVKRPERSSLGVEQPADRDKNAAGRDHQFRAARAERVDDPSFERGEPGFQRDEDAECDLDFGNIPGIRFGHRADEVGPAILKIGDHRHADDADDKLHPAKAVGRCLNWRSCCVSHWFPPNARFSNWP